MSGKGLRLKTELEIHAVSCPGVFFQCKAPVGGDGQRWVEMGRMGRDGQRWVDWVEMSRDGQFWVEMDRDDLMTTKSFNIIDSFRFSCLLNILFQSKFFHNEKNENVHINTGFLL